MTKRANVAGIACSCVRAPILVVLVLLEPIIGLVLYALAILGLLMTFLFKFVGAGAHFPFWTMLCLSLSFAPAHLAYHLAIRAVSSLKI
jgi:hypothetical protein